jgi:ribosomal protein S18 acetylase RimI-like enzyme
VPLGDRPVTQEDFALLQRLHREGMKPYVEELWGWDEREQEQILRKRFDPARLRVLRMDGHDVGILQVTRGAGLMRLDNILIDPAWRRRGIGRSVLDALTAEATARGAALTLSVVRPNPAKALYARAGFVVVSEDEFRFIMVWVPR